MGKTGKNMRQFDTWVSFAVDRDFKNRLQSQAKNLGIGRSAFVRLLLEDGLDRFSKDPSCIFKGV